MVSLYLGLDLLYSVFIALIGFAIAALIIFKLITAIVSISIEIPIQAYSSNDIVVRYT